MNATFDRTDVARPQAQLEVLDEQIGVGANHICWVLIDHIY